MLHEFVLYVCLPVGAFALVLAVLVALFGPRADPAPAPAPDSRTPLQRWEYAPPAASMLPAGHRPPLTEAEHWRARGYPDLAEQAELWAAPRPGAIVLARGAEPAAQRYPARNGPVCPVCEAGDDQPHGPECWLAGDELPGDVPGTGLWQVITPAAEPDTGHLTALLPLGALSVYLTALDLSSWHPFLSPFEFATLFPGVPYGPASYTEPDTGEMSRAALHGALRSAWHELAGS